MILIWIFRMADQRGHNHVGKTVARKIKETQSRHRELYGLSRTSGVTTLVNMLALLLRCRCRWLSISTKDFLFLKPAHRDFTHPVRLLKRYFLITVRKCRLLSNSSNSSTQVLNLLSAHPHRRYFIDHRTELVQAEYKLLWFGGKAATCLVSSLVFRKCAWVNNSTPPRYIYTT